MSQVNNLHFGGNWDLISSPVLISQDRMAIVSVPDDKPKDRTKRAANISILKEVYLKTRYCLEDHLICVTEKRWSLNSGSKDSYLEKLELKVVVSYCRKTHNPSTIHARTWSQVLSYHARYCICSYSNAPCTSEKSPSESESSSVDAPRLRSLGKWSRNTPTLKRVSRLRTRLGTTSTWCQWGWGD